MDLRSGNKKGAKDGETLNESRRPRSNDQNITENKTETECTSSMKDIDKSESKQDTNGETSTGPAAGTSGNQSPDPNCSICLGKLDNKSFTDSCFHMFCFTCLLEWSKVKAVCPLCKQSFKSIVHNVRSYDDYDQYNVADHARPQPDNTQNIMDSMLFENRRFRYRTTFTLERLMESHYRDRHHHLWSLHLRPTARSSTVRMQDNSRRQAVTTDFRRRLYMNHLKVTQVGSSSRSRRKMRDITPQFFSANPASTHRLVPWLNRELNALLDNNDNHVQFLLELIIDLIKRFTIESVEFYQLVHPFVGRRTRHFVHEFVSFARSPYDMVAYDAHALYDQTDANRSSDNESADSDVIVVVSPNENQAASAGPVPRLQRPPRLRRRTRWGTSPTRETVTVHDDIQFSPVLNTATDPVLNSLLQSSTDLSLLPSHSGWDDVTPGVFWPDIGLSFAPSASAVTSTINPLDLTRPSTTTRHIIPDTVSSDDDVQIIKVEKPYEQRSPIVLSSDSDDMIDITGDTAPSKKNKKSSNHPPSFDKHSRFPSHKRRHNSASRSHSSRRSRDHSSSKSSKKHKRHKDTSSRSNSHHRYQDTSFSYRDMSPFHYHDSLYNRNEQASYQSNNDTSSSWMDLSDGERLLKNKEKLMRRYYALYKATDGLKMSFSRNNRIIDTPSSDEVTRKRHKSHKKKHSKRNSAENNDRKKSHKHKKKHKRDKSRKSESHKKRIAKIRKDHCSHPLALHLV